MNLTNLKLNDRYVIEKELGRGGMGIVYLAHDTRLHSVQVVIKTMLDAEGKALDDHWFREKFDREIEALVRIKHHGVVGVIDLGQMPDGRPFFVMQYVDGKSLRKLIRGTRLELKHSADIIRQVGAALDAAHAVGVTHRDLKPENIMLQASRAGEEIVKLIDFGIATVNDLQAKQSHEKTKVAGTLPYLAPEQLRGEPVPASDIWSMGVIAYELVTGQLPFPTNNVLALAEMQRAGVSARPKALCFELSDAAQNVILKALSYDPGVRYRHAFEMGEEFVRAMGETAYSTDELTLQKDETTMPAGTTGDTPEDGHVLFMDLVGCATLPMPEQVRLISKLTDIVGETLEFRRAESGGHLISLSTGDGMVLVFFRNPVAPVQCALEIAAALKAYPDMKLRMGVHSGPVIRLVDINKRINVSGGGINLAQRVMDSGEAGHILVSRSVAENLTQLGDWEPHLYDLGEHKVKHGTRLHLFRLSKEGLGREDWPAKTSEHRPTINDGDKNRTFRVTAISYELREACVALINQFEELGDPDKFRAFASVSELRLVYKCIPHSAELFHEKLVAKLLTTGRSPLEPALFDLLNALAWRYREDFRGEQCEKLKEKIRDELVS